MYFVEYDVFNVGEPLRIVVNYVSENFGGHYKAGRVLVDYDVAGDDSYFVAVGGFEVAVFLVGKRLDWRSVYDFGVFPDAFIYYVFGHESFAGAGRRADYHRVLIVYGFERLDLKIV